MFVKYIREHLFLSVYYRVLYATFRNFVIGEKSDAIVVIVMVKFEINAKMYMEVGKHVYCEYTLRAKLIHSMNSRLKRTITAKNSFTK